MDLICRRLHFVGTSLITVIVLLNPLLSLAMATSGCFGYILCHLLAHTEKGFIEFGIAGLVYFLSCILLKIKWSVVLAVPLIGYAFAWV